jgi:acylphosphatase
LTRQDDVTTQNAIRREVLYSGRVQGVGFRWTARRLAQRFAVTGFVKNLPDRRVLLVAEGITVEVDGFLAEVRSHMGVNIEDATTTTGPATGKFQAFDIVH